MRPHPHSLQPLKKVSIFYSPSSLFYEVQHLLYTFYMLAPFFTIPSVAWFSLSVSLAIHHYSIPLVTELLTLQCIFKKLIHNHDYQYFHAIKLPSMERYIVVRLLNILVHLDITLWMFNWQLTFNMMKAVPDFLTWIPLFPQFSWKI